MQVHAERWKATVPPVLLLCAAVRTARRQRAGAVGETRSLACVYACIAMYVSFFMCCSISHLLAARFFYARYIRGTGGPVLIIFLHIRSTTVPVMPLVRIPGIQVPRPQATKKGSVEVCNAWTPSRVAHPFFWDKLLGISVAYFFFGREWVYLDVVKLGTSLRS